MGITAGMFAAASCGGVGSAEHLTAEVDVVVVVASEPLGIGAVLTEDLYSAHVISCDDDVAAWVASTSKVSG